jgi:pimeloyl-ACP methyl ester carboxylesterase
VERNLVARVDGGDGGIVESWRAHRLTVLAVTAALVLAAGCGGGDEDAGGGQAAKASPAATSESASREVMASVDGRELSGHCSGTQAGDSPAVLLESGMGGGQDQLSDIEARFARRTLVCAYERAGVGGTDPAATTPRPVSELVADLDAFAAAAGARPPYLLVGQSMGANVVFMYAQAHPEKVAGFVSMNPVPPAETWLDAAKKVQTKAEFAEERSFYRGANDESTSFLEPMLSDRLPSNMPYAVMFDEDCGGDSEFCDRILPALARTTRSLAAVGDGGRFVRAAGAGHNIFEVEPDLVQDTINDVLNDAN